MEIDLRWVASLPASGVHAADALRRGLVLADEQIASAIMGPAEGLIAEVREAGLPEELFWTHLAALCADVENPRELVESVLRKSVGLGPRAAASLGPLAAHVAGLQAAVRRATPELVEQVAAWARPLLEAWDRHGPGMLGVVAEYTEPELLVSHARVIVVYPALGGGGAAHLWYNTVRIEATPSDPVADLPEVVRLAWLVSQLQADLPAFSETMPRDRLHAVAAAAMLPPALAAAQESSLVAQGPLPIERAVEAWLPPQPASADLAHAIRSWWETYADARPAWHVALAALERMLHAEVPVHGV